MGLDIANHIGYRPAAPSPEQPGCWAVDSLSPLFHSGTARPAWHGRLCGVHAPQVLQGTPDARQVDDVPRSSPGQPARSRAGSRQAEPGRRWRGAITRAAGWRAISESPVPRRPLPRYRMERNRPGVHGRFAIRAKCHHPGSAPWRCAGRAGFASSPRRHVRARRRIIGFAPNQGTALPAFVAPSANCGARGRACTRGLEQ